MTSLDFAICSSLFFSKSSRCLAISLNSFWSRIMTLQNKEVYIKMAVTFNHCFFVIASSKIVEIIFTVSSQIVVLLLLSVLFLMLAGSFAKQGEDFALNSYWNVIFMVIMFFGIVFIFLNAITTKNGKTYLEVVWDWLSAYWTSSAVAAIVFIVLVIAFIYWVTSSGKSGGGGSMHKSEHH